MHSALWAEVAAELADDLTVHLVDLPGHGLSRDSMVALEPEAVVSAIQEQVPTGSVWMGWSLGGLFALHAAFRPECRVSRLVLVSSTPCFVSRPDWCYGVPADLFHGFAAALSQDLSATIRRFLALEMHGAVDARQTLKHLHTLLARRPMARLDVLRQGLALLEHSDFRHILRAVSMPVLMIGGRRDRLVHPDALTALAAACTQATTCIIPGAAHAPFVSAPAAFLRACRDFFATTHSPAVPA